MDSKALPADFCERLCKNYELSLPAASFARTLAEALSKAGCAFGASSCEPSAICQAGPLQAFFAALADPRRKSSQTAACRNFDLAVLCHPLRARLLDCSDPGLPVDDETFPAEYGHALKAFAKHHEKFLPLFNEIESLDEKAFKPLGVLLANQYNLDDARSCELSQALLANVGRLALPYLRRINKNSPLLRGYNIASLETLLCFYEHGKERLAKAEGFRLPADKRGLGLTSFKADPAPRRSKTFADSPLRGRILAALHETPAAPCEHQAAARCKMLSALARLALESPADPSACADVSAFFDDPSQEPLRSLLSDYAQRSAFCRCVSHSLGSMLKGPSSSPGAFAEGLRWLRAAEQSSSETPSQAAGNFLHWVLGIDERAAWLDAVDDGAAPACAAQAAAACAEAAGSLPALFNVEPRSDATVYEQTLSKIRGAFQSPVFAKAFETRLESENLRSGLESGGAGAYDTLIPQSKTMLEFCRLAKLAGKDPDQELAALMESYKSQIQAPAEPAPASKARKGL